MSAAKPFSRLSPFVVVEPRAESEVSSASAPQSLQSCPNFLSDDE
jgi:hypothetical protein